jgi:hypothetical protein
VGNKEELRVSKAKASWEHFFARRRDLSRKESEFGFQIGLHRLNVASSIHR